LRLDTFSSILNLPATEPDVSVTASDNPETTYKDLEAAIQKKFDIKECRIVKSFPEAQQTLKAMAKELGTMLEDILRDGDYLGIGWGTTLEAMARYLWMNKKIRVTIVTMAAGADIAGLESSINFVNRFFANKIGGSSYSIEVPGILDSKEAKQALVKNPNMLEFMKIAKKVTVGLTSIGRVIPDAALFKKNKISPQEVAYLQGLGIIGNVNFTFFDKQGKRIHHKLEERIMDVFPLEFIQKIGNMIGVAIGDDKVEVIRAALKGEIIHQLITDHATAEKVLKEN